MCQPSAREVVACIFLAVGLFGASLIPFFLLVDVEHLTPRVVRNLPATARQAAQAAALNTAVLFLLLTTPEAVR